MFVNHPKKDDEGRVLIAFRYWMAMEPCVSSQEISVSHSIVAIFYLVCWLCPRMCTAAKIQTDQFFFVFFCVFFLFLCLVCW